MLESDADPASWILQLDDLLLEHVLRRGLCVAPPFNVLRTGVSFSDALSSITARLCYSPIKSHSALEFLFQNRRSLFPRPPVSLHL